MRTMGMSFFFRLQRQRAHILTATRYDSYTYTCSITFDIFYNVYNIHIYIISINFICTWYQSNAQLCRWTHIYKQKIHSSMMLNVSHAYGCIRSILQPLTSSSLGSSLPGRKSVLTTMAVGSQSSPKPMGHEGNLNGTCIPSPQYSSPTETRVWTMEWECLMLYIGRWDWFGVNMLVFWGFGLRHCGSLTTHPRINRFWMFLMMPCVASRIF